MKITTLIVGSHFHPPAKTLLAGLPNGLPLSIVPEPENPYDENALLVTLDPRSIPKNLWKGLDTLLEGSGCEMAELAMQMEVEGVPITLGHVGKTGGKPLLKAGIAEGNVEVKALIEAGGYAAQLVFDAADGSPRIIVTPAGRAFGLSEDVT